MDFDEFVSWTESLGDEDRLTLEQAEDVRDQRLLFDAERDELEREFAGRVVGFAAGRRYVADDTVTLLDAATELNGRGRQVYFEPIAPPRPRTEQVSVGRVRVAATVGAGEMAERLLEMRSSRTFGAFSVLLVIASVALSLLGLTHLAGVASPLGTELRWGLVGVLVPILLWVGVRYGRRRVGRRRARREREKERMR